MKEFLTRSGWGGACVEPLASDWGPRRYFRINDGKQRVAVLMDSIPDDDPQSMPGHKISDFIRINKYLCAIGLHAPEIYAVDEDEGFVLLEDFGDLSFKLAIEEREKGKEDVYGVAIDVLIHLREKAGAEEPGLSDYYDSHVHKGRQRVVDWYMPAVRGEGMPDGLVEDYLSVWDEIEKKLPPCPQGFLHIDYHPENLMLLEGAKGLQRCGLLDFQGAMRGPLPYDLANLLEDIRSDVPENIRRAMLDRYCSGMNKEAREIFEIWYRVLATQFHCRIIGQCLKLAIAGGRDDLLAYLPRVVGYLRSGLEHPLLEPLQKWFAAEGIDFSVVAIDLEDASGRIRQNAF